MFDWIYDLSTQKVVIVFCVFFIGFAWMGTVFVRPILRLFVRRQAGLNDILSSFLSMYGVLFGILLGLIAVGAFQDRQEVDQSITSEATAVLPCSIPCPLTRHRNRPNSRRRSGTISSS